MTISKANIPSVEEWKREVKNKKIAVVGLGVSNVPLVHMLAENGANVWAYDKRDAQQLGQTYEEMTALGVTLILGSDYLDHLEDDFAYIFKTPGLRADVPQLKAVAERGTVITSEMELFFELCPAPIIAVTGSDGKTTTTTLIAEMLKRQGFTCYLGGNIGRPLLSEVENIRQEDKVVLELSSFQLQTMKKSPHIAVVTNVTPNHLDWHTDLAEYEQAKENIFRFQQEGDCAVFNYDNEVTRRFADFAEDAVMFSRRQPLQNGYCVSDGWIVYCENGKIVRTILRTEDIKIPGQHNVENYMAAIAAVNDCVSQETIVRTAKEFGGVPHRIELVRELDGVKYYNDSIASSPARTTAGLDSFAQKVILIAGGYDKKIPFDEFGAVVNDHVKELVLVGVTSEKIENAVRQADNYDGLPIHRCTEFEQAVNTARQLAQAGDVVILSPACASFDLFRNFEVRGNTFKDIVNSWAE